MLHGTRSSDPADRECDARVSELGDRSFEKRQAAREQLVAMGPAATIALTQALRDGHALVRWEAAKALSETADPAAAPMLIHALRDEDSGVRWVAAEALIAIGSPSITPLLMALVDEVGSPAFRESAHHVFHDLIDHHNEPILGPVLEALSGLAPATATPVAAVRALGQWQRFAKQSV